MANITFSNQDKRIARPKMTNNPLPPKESIETIAVHTRDPSTDSESPLLLLPSPVILSTMYHHNHYGGSGGSHKRQLSTSNLQQSQKRRVYVNMPLPTEEINQYGEPKISFVPNKIRTSKYTLLNFLPKNIFEQFHAFEDWKRHSQDNTLNKSRTTKLYNWRNVNVPRSDGKRFKFLRGILNDSRWQDVRVGDIIQLRNNKRIHWLFVYVR
ncbi:15857_t:CDS:2 [Entrophospora sp. SA101]|nr:15857_t:CDS:2 [Entrophospora sp. SA101]